MARGQRARGERRAPFWLAGEVADIARAFITEGGPHNRLVGKKIVYVYQKKMVKSQGMTVLGKAEVIGGKTAALSRGLPTSDVVIEGEERFFLITIAHGAWVNLTPAQKRAVVDHELSHCGLNDKGGICVWPHDLAEFRAVVERHGLYLDDVKKFAESCELAKQPKLDLDDEAPAEAKADGVPADGALFAAVMDPDGGEEPFAEEPVLDGEIVETAPPTLQVVNGGQEAAPRAVAGRKSRVTRSEVAQPIAAA